MATLRVDPESPEPERIARAAAVIRGGGLVAFPTETVYGLGANALDEAAVRKLYAAKGRPSYNPLIVHVADTEGARALVTAWPDAADRLARAFWPGPLTLVLPRAPRLPARVSAGLSTVAVRVPDHPIALALLHAADAPIVAPSANPSGAVSPTRAEHVERGLGNRVDLVLDGGPTGVGIESAVVDLSGQRPSLLRPGAISAHDLQPYVGELEPPAMATGTVARSSPGMLDRHYAPRATLHLFGPAERAGALARVRHAVRQGQTVGALLLQRPGSPEVENVHHLVRMPVDATAYARKLYDVLHRFDELGCELILVEAVPETPEWAGILDRLRRAGKEEEG